MEELLNLYSSSDLKKASENAGERKAFTDKAGLIFEAERNNLYKNGYSDGQDKISADKILQALATFNKMVELTIKMNKRDDGLYHSYNTVKIDNQAPLP